MRFPLLALFILTMLFSGCGGSGSSGGSPVTPHETPQPTVLAVTGSTGATDFLVDNGRIVFGSGDNVLTVPTAGGELTTLYARPGTSIGSIVLANGKVFMRHYRDVSSVRDGAFAVSTLVSDDGVLDWSDDVFTDGGFVYWSAGAKVYRTPLVMTPASAVATVFTGSAGGHVRAALDHGAIYVSDSTTRALYRVDLSNLKQEKLLTFPANASSEERIYSIPVVVDQRHVYALIDQGIRRINKTDLKEEVLPVRYSGAKIASDETGAYWWEPGTDQPNTLILKKSDSSGGISTLATIPYRYLHGTVSDGSHVYWFGDDDSGAGLAHKVERVAVTGGDVEAVASYAGADLVPSGITYDADNLYFSSPSGALIAKLSKTGGSPTLLTSNQRYAGVAVAGGFVVGINADALDKVPISGTDVSSPEWSLPMGSIDTVQHMAADADSLYLAAQHPDGATFDIYSRPLSGDAARLVATVSGHSPRIIPYDGVLLLLKATAGGGAISAIPKAGGNETVVVAAKGVQPADLQIVGNTMYFLADGVFALNLDTMEVRTIVPRKTSLFVFQGDYSIYVDDKNIYWTETSGTSGSLRRVPLAGGMPQTLYVGASFKVTGDAKRVYWSTGARILSLQK